MSEAVIFDIKRFSIHDGPGIRATVFFKGCPLRCLWCHNPEGLSKEIVLWHMKNKCIGCGICIGACKSNALSFDKFGSIKIDHGKCIKCGVCIEECPSGALSYNGRVADTADIFTEITKDKLFYETSGGGVTFSGGEALAQSEPLMELLRECNRAGIHTAIETSLFAGWGEIEKLAEYIDLFIVDLKLFNEEEHKKFTGVSNKKILDNFKKLSGIADEILVRIPLIPGYTDNNANIKEIVSFVKSLDREIEIELINYNPLAPDKYLTMGKDYLTGKDLEAFTDQEIEDFYSIIRGEL